MKNSLKLTGLTSCALMLSCSGEVGQASNLGIDPTFQNQLRVTEFATGLDFPSGILQLNDGSMVVATTTGGQYFFNSQSKTQLVRLQDTNGDGIADRKTVLYDGAIPGNNLPGGVSAIRAVDNYLFATNYNRQQISVFQQGADLSANSLTLKGSFNFSFPVNSAHTTNALAIRQTGAQQFELYFNVGAANPGSAGNNQATVPGSVSVRSGDFNLATTSLSGESLYKIPFTVGSSSLSFTQPVQVATGLRNAAALEFDTAGNLYIGDNGINGLIDTSEPLTGDELNRLTPVQLASAEVENFGFPGFGEKYRAPGVFIDGLGNIVNSNAPQYAGIVKPLVTFHPIPDLLTGSESNGVDSIALAPTAFPNGLNNGVFLAFFGGANGGSSNDLEDPVVYYDLATKSYLHFLSSNRGGDFANFISLLSTRNSLFAVDFGSGLGSGTIYQIQSAQTVPEPFTIVGTLIGGTAVLRMRKKLKDGNKA